MEKCNIQKNKPVLVKNAICPEKRATLTTQMPKPPKNGGLYAGPQVDHPWMPKPVIPTDTNLTYFNLLSANPPPGANKQFIGNIRPGNNYVAKIGVYKYLDTPESNCGPYDIEGVL